MSKAKETIARWGEGEELPPQELVQLARTSDERPGVLDADLEQLPPIRRRALTRRLFELAAERVPDQEAVAALAERTEELRDHPFISPEQERRLLAHLLAVGAQTAKQLADALFANGQADEERIGLWADDAEDRGLIERVEPGSPLRRWHISDRGRAVLGVPGAL